MKLTVSVILWQEGGSSSEAGDYFRKNKDKFPEVISCETAQRGEDWNRAVRRSNGDLILFVKADARDIKDDLYEKITDAFSDEKVMLLQGSVSAPDTTDALKRAYQEHRFPKQKAERTLADLCLYGLQNFLASNAFAVYRRSVFEKTGLFEPECLITPEILKAAQILYAGGKIVYDPEICATADASEECFDGFRKAFRMGVAVRYYAQIMGMDYDMLFTEDKIDFYPVIQKSMRDYYHEQRKAAAAGAKNIGTVLKAVSVEKQMVLADFIARKYHLLPKSLNRLFSGSSVFFA